MMDENPYISPQHIDLTTSGKRPIRYGKAWFLFFLVSAIGGFVAGAVIGGIIGAVLGSVGTNMATIQTVAQFAGFFIAIPISFLAYRWSVEKYILSQT